MDLTVEIKLPDGVLRLIAEAKSSGQPRLAREAVNQMLRRKSRYPDANFIFIAPYISPKAAEICRSEGIGYLDLSGNCLLSFDKVFIQKKDYPNQFKEKRDLKSLYAPKAERLLRVLLCNPGKKWKIKELSVESGGNLLLFTPYDDGVFYGSSRFNDIQVASKVQIYLDLQGFRGRGEEAAEMLYNRIVEKAW